jgi:hypothetical protein
VSIVVLKQPVYSSKVVETLEELLKLAKDGEIESFITVVMRPDGSFFTRSSCYKNSLELIGALHCAQHDLIVASEK